MMFPEYDLMPCPCCGRRLKGDDIHFFDEMGELIGDMEMVTDFDHITNPRNAVHPDDYDHLSKFAAEDLRQVVQVYQESVEAVSTIVVTCTWCGFGMSFDRWKSNYPDEGWTETFLEYVNRRSVKAMETTLKHIIDHACGGPVRQRYMDALIALMEIEKIRKEHEEMWEDCHE